MPVSCFTSPVLLVSGFSQGECYRDLQAADPSRKLIQYSLRTASTNLWSHLTGSHKELYRKVLEQKGWMEIIQHYLETRSSTTSAATTVPVTIPAVTPTFSSTSRPATSPEAPRDTSYSHVPLGSHVIHPRAPPSRPMPRDPVSRPRWVRLRESPPSTPDAPDEPESSTDPRIDSAVLTEDLSILQGLLSGLPMSLWSAVPDVTDGH